MRFYRAAAAQTLYRAAPERSPVFAPDYIYK